MSNLQVVLALRERRKQVEAEMTSYRAKASLAMAELDALDAAIDLFAADAEDEKERCARGGPSTTLAAQLAI
jgi:hypothetical protein